MLEAKNLVKIYRVKDSKKRIGTRKLMAVNHVSLKVRAGQTLGIVGESGSGKSTLARLLLNLEKPNQGDVTLDGKSVVRLKGSDLKTFRRNIQIVFQDPMSSLNPRMKIKNVLKEPFEIHREVDVPNPDAQVASLLERVGLSPGLKERYPHELSGGERQRVCIARAIALKPRIVVCDEAVSSLDVLIQAQILNLLLKLQKEDNLSYVFISHDLGVVRHMSDEILVMKDGQAVESGQAKNLFDSPKETYTQELLSASKLVLH